MHGVQPLFNKYCTCLEISASESGGKKEKVSNILRDDVKTKRNRVSNYSVHRFPSISTRNHASRGKLKKKSPKAVTMGLGGLPPGGLTRTPCRRSRRRATPTARRRSDA